MRCNPSIVELLSDAYASERVLSSFLSSQTIAELCHSNCTDIRIWTAKALVNDIANNVTIDWLSHLAVDQDPLVRVEAIDSLSSFNSPESYNILCSAMNDPDELVRAYAAYGIAVVGKELLPEAARNVLFHAELKEKSERVLVGIYEGLYILGYSDYLLQLFNLCQSDNYHVVCAVTHALEEIIDGDNRIIIESTIDSFDLSKQPIAVIDAITQLQMRCAALKNE